MAPFSQPRREATMSHPKLVLVLLALKYYATTEVTGNIGGMIDQLEARYGVQIPLSDLFLWGTDAAPLDKIESAMNAGQDLA
nr:DUF2092 domain-containing protein [Accumulibacter sp.]